MDRVLDVGLGARAVLAADGSGRVLSVHRHAVYLRTPGGLLGVTSGAAPPGPLHLRCAALPPCRPGERVGVGGGVVRARRWALDPTGAPTWAGTLPAPGPRAIAPAEVARYARWLGGRGPGLTPAGDDVLAGLLLVARAAAGDGERAGPGGAGGAASAAPRLMEIAGAVPTGEVAKAFLRWAARGQCIAPAHDALRELVSRGPDADGPACDRLAAIGASSGAALVAGLRIGLDPDRRATAAAISTMMDTHLPSLSVGR